MNTDIKKLQPQSLWGNFADLNAVPRPSKREEKVIAFMMDFGKKLGLETLKDEVGNVIIRKPATKGMENRKKVVLQSHLDMVHQKNNDTVFDFSTEGIKMKIEGDWVKAEGTTLGADNGIGVAAIMAILQSADIEHPDIEALFTIDEETGMTGAKGLKGGLLNGDILLNLDTEEDDEIDIGCAGGVDVTAFREYDQEEIPQDVVAYKIVVKGLQGGHSGMDIHKGFGNANKIMNRLLFDGFENFGLRISEINGGGLRNAIPRESTAIVVVDKIQNEAFEFEFKQLTEVIKHELQITEPNLSIALESTNLPENVMELGVQEGVLRSIYTAHNGVYAMSKSISDLVETSNNIARVVVKDGEIKIHCLTRSSVESAKFDLANALRSAFELSGFEVEFTGSYPGWEPDVNSSILKVLKEQYEKLFGEKPNVVACHAGLECGILGQNYPNMEMISFGPTIKGAHSPDEKVNIKSVQKFWKYLLEILKNIPQR
ncbi:aminoacyl-histidine dipeptidase [Capnocytophaga canimorsus]|uniref:aminoacyl-histidine dipeptidase n=1 Tax=Capnocytophaga canimorsus TaxID=28188 RepID=UPI000BB1CEB7|nr:aminoacyl-histidine dipeptidase [Capnocytophaga canimorsus]ATA76636.1 cytosol nonspecific dipeptidase [Capnocytophaga canimorsus]PJI76071.1 dipeptidase D [Capnocytophaga canimorsus]STA71810.1 Cytosol non-specific dipeptidase [Capnocytophaga canimorsus]